MALANWSGYCGGVPPTLKYFPFGRGLHQENDQRLNDAGSPRAVENLVRTKNGRLQPRRDYETLGMTVGGVANALSALRLYDLANFGDRLLAFGRHTQLIGQPPITYAEDATQHIYDLVEQPTHVWARTPGGELGAGTLARKIGRIGRKVGNVTRCDVAAGSGRVCFVYEVITNPSSANTSVGVAVIDPVNDTTLAAFQLSGTRSFPRVCCVDGKFFVTALDASDGSIELFVYDPAVGFLTQLTDLVPAGASVVAYDLAASRTASSFWAAVARSNTTTQLRGCNSSGTITYTTAGPAILCDAISVLHHVPGGTERFHVIAVRDTTLNTDLYTYLPPATAPALTTLDISALSSSVSQPAVTLTPNGTDLLICTEGPPSSLGTISIVGRGINFSTHAIAGIVQLTAASVNGKGMESHGRPLQPLIIREELGFFTHALGRLDDLLNYECLRPVCVHDRFLAQSLDRIHLPSVAYDSTTDLVYCIHSVEDEDRISSPQILELRVAGVDRRQTVVLGDVLYIAGAIVQAFDGRSAQEAGGFLTRPFVSEFVTSSDPPGTGQIDPGGTYQSLATMEYRDAKSRRMQSAPSNLVQATDAGSQVLDIRVERPFTLRDSGTVDTTTPEVLQTPPTLTLYRTLNIANGNGTFHLDQSLPARQAALKGTQTAKLSQSDVALSDNAILYTQGARGALSGPLEFVCPDPAGSICASADRIGTAQLINDSQIQESRPLFPGEQVQWNDTAGFFRDIRARTLAIARLDERRIIFTATELFECDGPGVDDNGLGEIGAPRRLPSDVGLHGGALGWRSIVEINAGILFQGLANQLYLLPRGGVTPIPIGDPVEDTLEEYPVIVAAVYMNEDRTVRFCCNNSATNPTESVILLFDVRFGEWFIEGPYAFGIRAAAKADGRFYLLTTANTVLRQRTSDIPLAFVDHAHRSTPVHGSQPGLFYDFDAAWCYGTFNGNFEVRCIVTFDERDTETSEWVPKVGRALGSQWVHRFGFNQRKCESVMVDFEFRAFQGQAVQGPHLTYWAIEGEPSKTINQIGPEDMT